MFNETLKFYSDPINGTVYDKTITLDTSRKDIAGKFVNLHIHTNERGGRDLSFTLTAEQAMEFGVALVAIVSNLNK